MDDHSGWKNAGWRNDAAKEFRIQLAGLEKHVNGCLYEKNLRGERRRDHWLSAVEHIERHRSAIGLFESPFDSFVRLLDVGFETEIHNVRVVISHWRLTLGELDARLDYLGTLARDNAWAKGAVRRIVDELEEFCKELAGKLASVRLRLRPTSAAGAICEPKEYKSDGDGRATLTIPAEKGEHGDFRDPVLGK